MVAARIRVEGTHTGKLYGIPATNKVFWFDEIAIFRLAKAMNADPRQEHFRAIIVDSNIVVQSAG